MNVIVVGNSSALLERQLGSRIDAFDRIVRINSFRVRGYEKHVGNRIDIVGTGRIGTVWNQDPAAFRAACEVWMKRPRSYCQWDVGTQRVVTHFSIPDEKLRYPDEELYWSLVRRLVEATNRDRPSWRLPFYAERRPGWLRTLMLRAGCLIGRFQSGNHSRPGLWRSIRRHLPLYPLQPSTGVVMLEMALDRFGTGQVHVVGFDQFRGGHYWDRGATGLPGHPWRAERQLIDERIRSGQLRCLE